MLYCSDIKILTVTNELSKSYAFHKDRWALILHMRTDITGGWMKSHDYFHDWSLFLWSGLLTTEDIRFLTVFGLGVTLIPKQSFSCSHYKSRFHREWSQFQTLSTNKYICPSSKRQEYSSVHYSDLSSMLPEIQSMSNRQKLTFSKLS